MTGHFPEYWRDYVSIAGLIVSLLGAALTVWYSWSAKNAAEAAQAAATDTKVRIANVDVFATIKDLLAMLRDIGIRVEGGEHGVAREKALDAIASAIDIIESPDVLLTQEKQELLSIFVVQMRELNETLLANTRSKRNVDVARILGVLALQREALTKVQAEAKRRLQGGENG